MKAIPLCFDGLLWPCCDPVVATFPQAVCPHSRKLLWLQPPTVFVYLDIISTITQYYTCIMAVSVKPAAVSPRSLQLGCRRHGEWEGHPVVIRETAWVRDGPNAMGFVLYSGHLWDGQNTISFFLGGKWLVKSPIYGWFIPLKTIINRPQIHNEWFKRSKNGAVRTYCF